MKYTVYIIKSCCNNSYYTGVTNNTTRRIYEHNKGLTKSTKKNFPWRLVYTEDYNDIKEAYSREKYIKSRKKREYINKLILVNDNERL